MARGAVLAVMFAGCIIPPALSVDTTDAGANAAPAIISVRADGVELPEYATLVFERGLGTLTMTVHDTDLDDPISGRLFVEYRATDPTPPRAFCQSGAARSVVRSCTFELLALCQQADLGVERLMQLHVFDRQVLDTGEPAFQSMTEGGLSTSRTYFLRCVERQQ